MAKFVLGALLVIVALASVSAKSVYGGVQPVITGVWYDNLKAGNLETSVIGDVNRALNGKDGLVMYRSNTATAFILELHIAYSKSFRGVSFMVEKEEDFETGFAGVQVETKIPGDEKYEVVAISDKMYGKTRRSPGDLIFSSLGKFEIADAPGFEFGRWVTLNFDETLVKPEVIRLTFGAACQKGARSVSFHSIRLLSTDEDCPLLAFNDNQPFNALVFKNFIASSSGVQGALFVGGNCSVASYSVGDKIETAGNGGMDSLVVGETLLFKSGRAKGNVVYSGSDSDIHSSVTNGALAVIQSNERYDFEAAHGHYSALTLSLKSLPATGDVETTDWSLQFRGVMSSPEVFDVSCEALQARSSVSMADISTGVNAIVFNVGGRYCNLKDLSILNLNSDLALWNFYEATDLVLDGVQFPGSILAPYADVVATSGSVIGQVVANSWQGSSQIEFSPFRGCVDTIPSSPMAGLVRVWF